MVVLTFDAKKPVRVRLLSPLGYYPKHSILIPDARLLVQKDIIVSAVVLENPAKHGITSEHSSELEFLSLEEIRFLAAIALAVHPDNGMAYTYPLLDYVNVSVEFGEDDILKAARGLVATFSASKGSNTGAVLPPCSGGPVYNWREVGVGVSRVQKIASATALQDHLLMRGLGCLLRADMCCRHGTIAEAAVSQLHVAMEASFQMMLRILRERGVVNPSAMDAGRLVDTIFNPGIESGQYFQDYYEDRIINFHPSSRFGVFPFAPLQADDYYFLRHGLIEVYHWLITQQKLEPEG